MDTIFMNSENSRTFEYHVLVLKLTEAIHLFQTNHLVVY